MSTGRPSSYDPDLAIILCTEISTSNKSLKRICMEDEYLPDVSTVYRWIRDIDEFRNLYARAQEDRADYLAEEMLEIADDNTNDTIVTMQGEMENKEWVNRSKLRVETRKWIASKLKPKKYGEKLDVTTKDKEVNGFVIHIDGSDKNTD